MLNLWIQTEHPFASWDCTFDAARIGAPQLIDLIGSIVTAGETHRVLTPLRLPRLGYRRGETAGIRELLSARWEREGILDLDTLAGHAAEVTASLCIHDADDHVIERDVVDLGAELRALEPSPGSIPDGFTESFPAIRVWGIPLGGATTPLPEVRLTIPLHSDIWFPYVHGAAHPLVDFKRYFDNRALARCHTPRLNGFLREVAAGVIALGGNWSLDAHDTAPPLAPWVSAVGINLDGPTPALHPPESLAAEWY